MKLKNISTLLALAALSTINFQLSIARAQGSLTPPAGAPAPVMKSLDQVEARIPLIAGQPGVSVGGNGSIVIGRPGSYYLTTNLTLTTASHGINLGTNSVSLDLNGFRIVNVNGFNTSDAGVVLSGVAGQTVEIRNGHIAGGGTNNTGFGRGIFSISAKGTVRVENVHVASVWQGIFLLSGNGHSVVENCTVNNTGNLGISADVVRNCVVQDTVSYGIDAPVVSDCHVIQSFGSGNGINADVVANSIGISVGGNGIDAKQVTNCRGESTTGTGLIAETAMNCYGYSASGSYGMNVSGTASFCRAFRTGGTAINAGIAIGCTAASGTITSSQKFLGTP